MNGVLVVNKEKEFTSFDVVAVVRKLTGQRKIGHCGTLDPNATGVLPLLLGGATKAQDIILNHDKEYTASFLLGKTTDTLDIWGNVLSEQKSYIKEAEINQKLEHFRGEISQTPPMFSAVKKDGKRLYDLARQGIEVERESRIVTVYEIKLLDFNEETQSGSLYVKCSKGTYIRSIIDDLGKLLGCGGVMTALERTSACGYKIEQALTLDEIKKLCAENELQKRLFSVESLFSTLRYATVTDAQANRFSNGGALDIERTYLKNGCKNGELFRVKSRDNRFLGLGKADTENGLLRIYKLFF